MSEQRCDNLYWRGRKGEARDIGRKVGDQNGQDGKCLNEGIGWDPRLYRKIIGASK